METRIRKFKKSSPGLRAFLPKGLVSLVLLAAGCTTEDGPVYDIPARLQVMQIQFEAGLDGSPMILAQIGMYYRTASPDTEPGGGYQMPNLQSIVYTKDGGNWNAHSFRNLQRNTGGLPLLLRNADGEFQPLIHTFDRYVLYARRGDDWIIRKSTLTTENGSSTYFPVNLAYGAAAAMVGDSAWQALEMEYSADTPPRYKVRGSDGASIDLESGNDWYWDRFGLMVPGKAYNYLVLFPTRGSQESGQPSQILCYRWSLDHRNPGLRKQVLAGDTTPEYGKVSSATVSGETRVYRHLSSNSLAEFAIRGDSLTYLGLRSMPADQTPTDSAGTPFISLSVDPGGCLHGLWVRRDSSAWFPPSLFVHRSSCEETADTLRLPNPAQGTTEVVLSDLNWAPDGSPMVALRLIGKSESDGSLKSREPPPSWIYFGRRGPGKAWTWEKVAEF